MGITVSKALKIINKYVAEKAVEEDEEELLAEAFDFLIEIRKDTDLMRLAGDYYAYRGKKDLADVYYKMAEEYSLY